MTHRQKKTRAKLQQAIEAVYHVHTEDPAAKGRTARSCREAWSVWLICPALPRCRALLVRDLQGAVQRLPEQRMVVDDQKTGSLVRCAHPDGPAVICLKRSCRGFRLARRRLCPPSSLPPAHRIRFVARPSIAYRSVGPSILANSTPMQTAVTSRNARRAYPRQRTAFSEGA